MYQCFLSRSRFTPCMSMEEGLSFMGDCQCSYTAMHRQYQSRKSTEGISTEKTIKTHPLSYFENERDITACSMLGGVKTRALFAVQEKIRERVKMTPSKCWCAIKKHVMTSRPFSKRDQVYIWRSLLLRSENKENKFILFVLRTSRTTQRVCIYTCCWWGDFIPGIH